MKFKSTVVPHSLGPEEENSPLSGFSMHLHSTLPCAASLLLPLLYPTHGTLPYDSLIMTLTAIWHNLHRKNLLQYIFKHRIQCLSYSNDHVLCFQSGDADMNYSSIPLHPAALRKPPSALLSIALQLWPSLTDPPMTFEMTGDHTLHAGPLPVACNLAQKRISMQRSQQ